MNPNPERNEAAVSEHLREGLGCAVETRRAESGGERIFVPAKPEYGELHLSEELVAEGDPDRLLGRLRRDGVAELLEKGERIRVTRPGTEILPRR